MGHEIKCKVANTLCMVSRYSKEKVGASVLPSLSRYPWDSWNKVQKPWIACVLLIKLHSEMMRHKGYSICYIPQHATGKGICTATSAKRRSLLETVCMDTRVLIAYQQIMARQQLKEIWFDALNSRYTL